jgi:hypothetical protein
MGVRWSINLSSSLNQIYHRRRFLRDSIAAIAANFAINILLTI